MGADKYDSCGGSDLLDMETSKVVTDYREKMRSASRCDLCRGLTWASGIHKPVEDLQGRWHHPECPTVVRYVARSITMQEVAHLFRFSGPKPFDGQLSVCSKSRFFAESLERGADEVCFVCKTEIARRNVQI